MRRTQTQFQMSESCHNTIDKSIICNRILNVCKAKGWHFEENVKTTEWKADIIVDYGNYKVAFNICKMPRRVKEIYQAMRSERVCGCWLLLPSKSTTVLEEKLPCFHLTERGHVILMKSHMGLTKELSLSDFTQSIIEGRIRWANEMTVHHADLCFFQKDCWKCRAKNHVYFIHRLYSEEGIEVCYLERRDEQNDLTFNPHVIKAIQNYITEHPDLGIKMGTINFRYSRTSNRTYMSFGCYRCDSLFGENIINNTILEYCYCADELLQIKIDISKANLVFPARCWYKRLRDNQALST